MNANHLSDRFAASGARLKIQLTEPRQWQEDDFAVEIHRDRHHGIMPLRVPQRARRIQARASCSHAHMRRPHFRAGRCLPRVAEKD
jgi:hypothetical protein